MFKENRNPNRLNNPLNKSINNKSKHQLSTTPDANTSRANYKPKFIKKFVDKGLASTSEANTPQESVHQHGETYMHSPVSMT